jgi:hypothetical protein
MENMAVFVYSFYKMLGFNWHNQVALILTYCFAISLAANVFISIVNIVLPRKTPFEIGSKILYSPKNFLFLGIYMLAFVCSVGIWGSNMSKGIREISLNYGINSFDIFVVSFITFLLSSMVVDVIGFIVFLSMKKFWK